MDKPGKSAFAYTDLELLLKVCGVRNLVVCGLTTDVYVAPTVREASDRGYGCLLVEDVAGASVESLDQAAVEMVQTEGGIVGAVATTVEVVEGLRSWSEQTH